MSSEEGRYSWKLGLNHSATQWQTKMRRRGWTFEQIEEAIQFGSGHTAVNKINPNNDATRFIHPFTGRSLVRDDMTGEIIHLGGDDFAY